MSTKKQTHIHRYQRIYLDNAKTVQVWRCVKTDCSHYVQKQFLAGKTAECWRCGNEFVLSRKHVRTAKPMCCVKHRNIEKEIEQEAFADFLKRVGL